MDKLVSDAEAAGYSVTTFDGFANKGDILVYGNNDHVVISDGAGGAFGNSSSAEHAMYYSDANNAWHTNRAPSKVIHIV